MELADEMIIFRAWCRKAGNYTAVATIDRWLKMSPKQRAEGLRSLQRKERTNDRG